MSLGHILDFERPLVDLRQKIEELHGSSEGNEKITQEVEALRKHLRSLEAEIFNNLTPWQKVQLARHPKRPYTLDYIGQIFEDFVELHGDRLYGDDPSIVSGLAQLDERPVMVIGQQKGRTTKEKIHRNFGMCHPEGYRKAMRLMDMAARFNRPIITFIDTPGAYPGIGSEERGVAEAIARNLRIMMEMPVPIVVVVIGEGGSGGALGIGVGNIVLMFAYSIYSVISPEGCAGILFKDDLTNPDHAADMAKSLGLTAPILHKFGIIEEILDEPAGGAHTDPAAASATVKDAIKRHLSALDSLSSEDLIQQRMDRFARLGEFIDG